MKVSELIEALKDLPEDAWNADITLAKIIAPVIEEIIEQTDHFPSGIDQEDLPPEIQKLESYEQWKWILGEMLFAFKHHQSLNWVVQFQDEKEGYRVEEAEQHWERMRRGWRFFGRYYENLWT